MIFSEMGDPDYPFPVSEASPPCVTMLGSFRRPHLLLIGSNRLSDSVLEKALIFSLECAIAGHQVMSFGLGSFSRSLCNSMKQCGRAPVVLLKSGLEELFSSFGFLIHDYCLYGGGFISPFLPHLHCRDIPLEALNEAAASFSPLVFFSMAPYEFSIAQSCLDKGGMVYLHYAALSYPLARVLAKEGAPVIEHVDNSKGYVYKRKDGLISFLDLS